MLHFCQRLRDARAAAAAAKIASAAAATATEIAAATATSAGNMSLNRNLPHRWSKKWITGKQMLNKQKCKHYI